jgi:winged helix domain-containing protein
MRDHGTLPAAPTETAGAPPRSNHGRAAIGELFESLRRLDRILERAAELAPKLFGAEAVADPFKGLHIATREVGALLARPPGMPLFWSGDAAAADDPLDQESESRLAWLVQTFGLDSFDVDVLLIALAPELDLRYERIYAFLQNDVTRRRPSVELALDLWCSSRDDKLARRSRFAPDAPLLHQVLVELLKDPQHVRPPLLAHYLKLDEQITRFLLGESSLDPRLAHCCELVARPAATRLDGSSASRSIGELALDQPVEQQLRRAAALARESARPLQLSLRGAFEADHRQIARALAADAGVPLLVADVARALGDGECERTARLLFREAWFQGAVLYLYNLDELTSDQRSRPRAALMKGLVEQRAFTLLSGAGPWVSVGETPNRVVVLPISAPRLTARRSSWQKQLAIEGITLDEHDLVGLAGRFRVSSSQIAQAVVSAQEQARWRGSSSDHAATQSSTGRPSVADLFAAARSQCGNELARVTQKIEPKYGWADIVLPDDTCAQLREICGRAEHRHRVLVDWDFDGKLSHGKGLNALFAGPSGTGKTMAAEVIAKALGLLPDRSVFRGQQVHRRNREEPRPDLRCRRKFQRHPLLRRSGRSFRQALRGP